MPLTNFVANSTKIVAAWLNKIDIFYVTIFEEAITKAAAASALGFTSGVGSYGAILVGAPNEPTAKSLLHLTGYGTGTFNTTLGDAAGSSNTTGSSCTAIGSSALSANLTGGGIVAVGSGAMFSGTGNNNTAIGVLTLSATTGANNTALGYVAGNSLTTGSNCTLIGYAAAATSVAATNEITLGNASIATLRCQVTSITALSDKRDKKEIEDIGVGLDFVSRLAPVKFKWALRDGTEKPDVYEAGFIAQDLKQVQEEFNTSWLGLVYESNPEKLEATPGKLLPVLVKAIQELAVENEELKKRLTLLEAK